MNMFEGKLIAKSESCKSECTKRESPVNHKFRILIWGDKNSRMFQNFLIQTSNSEQFWFICFTSRKHFRLGRFTQVACSKRYYKLHSVNFVLWAGHDIILKMVNDHWSYTVIWMQKFNQMKQLVSNLMESNVYETAIKPGMLWNSMKWTS